MWFASKEIIEERRAICKDCKFAQKFAKGTWCGTPVIGGTVTFKKKKHKLCGCNMTVKTAFRNVECSVGKWSAVGEMTAEQKEEARAFLKTINTDYISREDLVKLYDLAFIATGHKLPVSNCAPCVKDLLTKLKSDVG
jgi:hypothetical protein